MALPGFFKLRQNNRFNYTPVYWDPDKEAREERVNRIKAELGQELPANSIKASSSITRGSFRQYSRHKVKASRESNRRIILIIVFLGLVSYLLLYR